MSKCQKRNHLELTSRQLEALQAVDSLTEKHGRGLSFQEVADALGVSKTAAVKHLEALRVKGWVEWSGYRSVKRTNPVMLQRLEELERRLAKMGDNMNQGSEHV